MNKFDKGFIKNKSIFYVYFLLVVEVVYYIYLRNNYNISTMSNDDWTISNILSGAYGVTHINCIFSSKVLARGMVLLYKYFPKYNWFILLQEIIILVSLGIITLIFVNRTYRKNGLWSIFLCSEMIVLLPYYSMNLQYTITASVGSVVGLTLLIYSFQCGWNIGILCGGILSILAASYRIDCFYLVMPFIVMILFSTNNKKKDVVDKKNIFAVIRLVLAIGVVFFIVTAIKYDNREEDAYYAEYNKYNQARSMILDYNDAEYKDYIEEFRKIGLSESAYNLITWWNLSDYEYMNSDLFFEIAKIVGANKKGVKSTFSSCINEYIERITDKDNYCNFIFVLSIITTLVLLTLQYKKWYLSIAVVLLNQGILLFFVFYYHRYPVWLRSGVEFATIMVLFFQMGELLEEKEINKKLLLSLPIAASVIIVTYMAFINLTPKTEKTTKARDFYQYINQRTDEVFLIPTADSGMYINLQDEYGSFETTKRGTFSNVISMGGWTTKLPWLIEQQEALGIYNPMKQITDKNVFIVAPFFYVEEMKQYYTEHYGEITLSLVENVYGYPIYKAVDGNKRNNNAEITSEIVGCQIIHNDDFNVNTVYVALLSKEVAKDYCLGCKEGDEELLFWSTVESAENTQDGVLIKLRTMIPVEEYNISNLEKINIYENGEYVKKITEEYGFEK